MKKYIISYDESKFAFYNFFSIFSGIPRNHSWILRVKFRSQEYKEIRQVRAYDAQSLIGNAGGYIGLFLGCALRELPSFMLIVYKIICDALQKTRC